MLRKNVSLVVIGFSAAFILFSVYKLGTVYAHSWGMDASSRGDYAEARRILRISAELGYTYSKVTLGSLYLTGKGGAADAKLADRFLASAATDGLADAQAIYGMALYAGATLPMNQAQGIYWLKKAAAQGDRGAREFLARSGNQ